MAQDLGPCASKGPSAPPGGGRAAVDEYGKLKPLPAYIKKAAQRKSAALEESTVCGTHRDTVYQATARKRLAEAKAMANSMFHGASLTRLPESWAKKAKNGILMPECSITPADAISSTIHTGNR